VTLLGEGHLAETGKGGQHYARLRRFRDHIIGAGCQRLPVDLG
jgi:hypothetical protein